MYSLLCGLFLFIHSFIYLFDFLRAFCFSLPYSPFHCDGVLKCFSLKSFSISFGLWLCRCELSYTVCTAKKGERWEKKYEMMIKTNVEMLLELKIFAQEQWKDQVKTSKDWYRVYQIDRPKKADVCECECVRAIVCGRCWNKSKPVWEKEPVDENCKVWSERERMVLLKWVSKKRQEQKRPKNK